jgi:glycosyltransferase involved in cell wall biosynthesis
MNLRPPPPTVSVVVPTLNRRSYLEDTIDSILEQDYPSLECIVVDGGSTDGSVELLSDYGDAIRWISEPDDGHADAVNKGWAMASGDILAWLNADDCYAHSGAVSAAVRGFLRNQDADVVYGDYVLVDRSGQVLEARVRPDNWCFRRAVRQCDHILPQATTFMRASILRRVGYLDEDFGNGKDHDLWLRIALAEGTFHRVDDIIAAIRWGGGLTERADMGEAKLRVTRKFFSQPDLPDEFQDRKFRRRTWSNSYYTAAVYSYRGEAGILTSLKFYIQAIWTDPTNTLTILRELPGFLYRLARAQIPLLGRLLPKRA